MTQQRVIRAGVVGCGYWGPNIIRNLTGLLGAGNVTACDLSEQRLAVMAERFPGLQTTTETRAVLRDPSIQAVVIATPIRTHHRLALQALLHGKHVLVEKPLTASVEESEQLVD